MAGDWPHEPSKATGTTASQSIHKITAFKRLATYTFAKDAAYFLDHLVYKGFDTVHRTYRAFADRRGHWSADNEFITECLESLVYVQWLNPALRDEQQ